MLYQVAKLRHAIEQQLMENRAYIKARASHNATTRS